MSIGKLGFFLSLLTTIRNKNESVTRYFDDCMNEAEKLHILFFVLEKFAPDIGGVVNKGEENVWRI